MQFNQSRPNRNLERTALWRLAPVGCLAALLALSCTSADGAGDSAAVAGGNSADTVGMTSSDDGANVSTGGAKANDPDIPAGGTSNVDDVMNAGGAGGNDMAMPPQPGQRPKKPNIVLILADDMGWSDIGAYGSEIETPNLDALAMGGIRFTTFYQTSKCFPTRASLMTGTYAHQSGLHGSHTNKMKNSATIGEVLRAAGYRTLMTGKHHAIDNPFERGFDRSYGLLDGASNHFNPGLQRPGEPEPAQKRNRTWMDDDDVFMTRNPDKQHYFPKDYYSTDAFTDRALEYFEEYADEDKPFLLYVAYTAPHDPLHAPEASVAKYKGVYNVGYEAIRQARYERQVASGLIDPERFPLSPATHGGGTPSADQIERMETYAGMVDRMDWNIGRLIDKLKEQGKFEDTLFLFASDNGASSENVAIGSGPINQVGRYASQQGKWANVSNTPFRFFKNFSYNGGITSPLIAHWPKGIAKPGTINHYPLHLIDLMATFVELGEAEYPRTMLGEDVHAMQGISFAPLLWGEEIAGERPPLFFQWADGSAVREMKWKLVKEGEGWDLYDMTEDMSETNNLAAQHPDQVQRLEAMYEAWQEWRSKLPPDAQDDSLQMAPGEMATVDVLSNDAPAAELDPASVAVRVAPEHGELTIDPATGAITYQHSGDGPGEDSFQYVVYTKQGSVSHRATVQVTLQ